MTSEGNNHSTNLFSRLLAWIGRHEPLTLLAIGIVAAFLWIFIELADEVLENETHAIDRDLLLVFRNPADPSDPVGPPWVENIVRDITALGSLPILAFVTLAVAGYFFLSSKRRAAGFLLGAVVGGLALGIFLKSFFDRPRPDLVVHRDHVLSASFPSNHSLMAAVVYLTLGVMLARFEARPRLRAYFLLLAVFLTLAVGVSRVYLGVHWPSDVLGGWAIGAAWAISCWLAARWLQRRGQVEKTQPASNAQ